MSKFKQKVIPDVNVD